MRKSDVIEYFGSQVAVARALGLTKGAVHLWKKIVPYGRAVQIEAVTNQALRVDPKFYPRYANHQERHSSASLS
jgi:transcriptional repressor of cell division inhibition gene dicB